MSDVGLSLKGNVCFFVEQCLPALLEALLHKKKSTILPQAKTRISESPKMIRSWIMEGLTSSALIQSGEGAHIAHKLIGLACHRQGNAKLGADLIQR